MSRAARRYYRTIFLGIAAMATLIWAAIDQFGLSPREMLDLLLTTVLAIGTVIILAGGFVLLWMGARALLRRRR